MELKACLKKKNLKSPYLMKKNKCRKRKRKEKDP